MTHAGATRRRSVPAELNVTPLVDVMLVLLILFMVTVPLAQRRLDVRLPSTSAAPDPAAASQAVRLVLDSRRTLLLAGPGAEPVEVGAAELPVALRQAVSACGGCAVVVEADGASSYQQVASLLGEVRAAGAVAVGLAVAPAVRP